MARFEVPSNNQVSPKAGINVTLLGLMNCHAGRLRCHRLWGSRAPSPWLGPDMLNTSGLSV